MIVGSLLEEGLTLEGMWKTARRDDPSDSEVAMGLVIKIHLFDITTAQKVLGQEQQYQSRRRTMPIANGPYNDRHGGELQSQARRADHNSARYRNTSGEGEGMHVHVNRALYPLLTSKGERMQFIRD